MRQDDRTSSNLTINRVNIVSILKRNARVFKRFCYKRVGLPHGYTRNRNSFDSFGSTDLLLPLLLPLPHSSPSKSYAAGMKRLLSPWPFVSDSFGNRGRYSPRSVIRFEFCKVDRGGPPPGPIGNFITETRE